jgi:hypothetical protein
VKSFPRLRSHVIAEAVQAAFRTWQYYLSFPKIPSGLGFASWGRIHRIIGVDASTAFARNVHRRPVQVAVPLEAKNLFLRHQLSIALRRVPPRRADRALLILMTRLWPSLLGAGHVGSARDFVEVSRHWAQTGAVSIQAQWPRPTGMANTYIIEISL